MPSFSALILTAAAAGSSYAALEAYGAPAPPAYASTEKPYSSVPAYHAPEQSYAPKGDEHSSHEPQWYSSPAQAQQYTTTAPAAYGPPSTTSCTEDEEKSTSTFVPYSANEETTISASYFSMHSSITIDTSSYATTTTYEVPIPYYTPNVPYYPEHSSDSTSSESKATPYYMTVPYDSVSTSTMPNQDVTIVGVTQEYTTVCDKTDTATYGQQTVYKTYSTISTATTVYYTTVTGTENVPYYPKETYPAEKSYPKETPYSWSTTEEHKTLMTYPSEKTTWETTAPVYKPTESAPIYGKPSESAPVYKPSESAPVYSKPSEQTWSTEEQKTYQQTWSTEEAKTYPTAPVYKPSESAPAYKPSESSSWSAPPATAPVMEYQPGPSASEAYPVMPKETYAPAPPAYKPQESAPPASAPVMEYQPSAGASWAVPAVPKESWVPKPTYPATSATATTTKQVTIVPVPATEYYGAKSSMMTHYPGAASPTGSYGYGKGGNGTSNSNSTKPWNKPESYTGGASVNSFSIAALTIALFGAAFAL